MNLPSKKGPHKRVKHIMYNNRTIEYLQAFQKNDWKEFKKFQSEKINPGTELEQLIKHFISYQYNLGHKSLSIEYINQHLFPKKTRKSVSNLFSQFTALIREFLVINQLNDQEHNKKILLIQALNKRHLYREADKLTAIIEKDLGDAPLDYFNALYKQQLHHHIYFSDNPIKYSNRGKIHLQKSIDHLNQYHQHLRALYYLETQNMSIIQFKFQYEIDDDFSFDNQGMEGDQLLQITYHLFETRINNKLESAQYLKNTLFEQHHRLSEEVRMNIYIVLRMYFARKANKGDINMAYEVFKLNKLIVKYSYFDYEGQVDPKRFIPVVELAVFLDEIDWAEEFIENHKDNLSVINKNSTIKIARALIHFGKKEYTQTLQILNRLYPKELYYKNIVMRLSLIAYLEDHNGDTYFIQQRIENFKLFYYRNKRFLTKRIYNSSNNLIKVIQMIVAGKKKEDILKQMHQMEYIFYRLYLFKKLM